MAVARRDATVPAARRRFVATRRTARVLLCFHGEHLVALHGFIKKTRTTPDADLALACRRQKDLEQ